MPLEMDRIYEALGNCDLFVSIGTSGNVYPAAGFVAEAHANGHAHTVELNLEPSEGYSLFDERRYGRASVEDFDGFAELQGDADAARFIGGSVLRTEALGRPLPQPGARRGHGWGREADGRAGGVGDG